MIGVTGALVALAVVLGIVLVLAVRPAARRFTRAAEALRGDVDTGLDRLRALRRARPSANRGSGRHRRPAGAP